MKYTFDTSTLIYFIEKLKEKFSLKTEVTEQINELEKIESSETEPTNEMVGIWINTSEDESTNVIARINDDTIASNTTWSSEKINASIISGGGSSGSDNVDLSAYALKTDLHSHNNKTVLDNITSAKVSEWNNKSTFSGNYNDLTNKPTIPTIPTNISSFTNVSGYITSIPSEYITDSELTAKGYATEDYVTTAIDNAQLSGSGETVDMTKYALKTDVPTSTSQLTNDSNFITSIPSEYITETELTAKGYLTEHQDISHLADKSDIPTKTSELTNDSGYLTSIPSEYVTDSELTAKGYATEDYVDEAVDNLSELKMNIVNGLTFANAYINYNNGDYVSGGSAYACQEYIPVISDATYEVSGVSNIVRIAYYDSSKTYMNQYIDNTPTFNFTPPSDASYIRVHVDSNSNAWQNLSIESEIEDYIRTYISNATSGGSGNVDLSSYALKTDLHSHSNKTILDNITSDMTTKWNQSIPFNDTYASDCNAWLTNGYIRTGANQTANLPSACTGSDRWGILFFIAENATQGTGTQMYFPIDGTYKGRIFTRSLTNMKAGGSSVGEWNLISTFSGNYNDLTNKPTIPTNISAFNNDSGYITSIPSEYITETELNAKGYLTAHQDISGKADKTELHNHSNKTILDDITSEKITLWDNKSTFSGSYDDLTNKPTIPTVTNDLTNTLKSNYDAGYTHSQSTHAPSNAQKNSDITKTEIEAKLTGNITSHTHSQYLTEHQDLSNYALKSEIPTNYLTSIPSEYITETELVAREYLTTSQIPTSLPANGGNADTIGGFSIWSGTQAQYDAIETKSNTTLYFIKEG